MRAQCVCCHNFLQFKSLVFMKKNPDIIRNLFLKKLYKCPLSHIVQTEIIEQYGTWLFFISEYAIWQFIQTKNFKWKSPTVSPLKKIEGWVWIVELLRYHLLPLFLCQIIMYHLYTAFSICRNQWDFRGFMASSQPHYWSWKMQAMGGKPWTIFRQDNRRKLTRVPLSILVCLTAEFAPDYSR